jgi:hypothetical protein
LLRKYTFGGSQAQAELAIIIAAAMLIPMCSRMIVIGPLSVAV